MDKKKHRLRVVSTDITVEAKKDIEDIANELNKRLNQVEVLAVAFFSKSGEVFTAYSSAEKPMLLTLTTILNEEIKELLTYNEDEESES